MSEIFHAIWDPDRCPEGVFCPRCDTWMDDHEGQPDKCPNCGVELDGWIRSERSKNNNLPERYKTCGRCIHDSEDPNIIQSICYLCKRNSDDNRIDWFEEREKDE